MSRPLRAGVLIVEDDPDISELTAARLRKEGLTVRCAQSGEEALAAARTSPPDLLVLDLMMPGMDGYKFARVLRGMDGCGAVPIVVVTALSHRDHRKRALEEAGARAFFTKPFEPSRLAAMVLGLLEPTRAAAPPAEEETPR